MEYHPLMENLQLIVVPPISLETIVKMEEEEEEQPNIPTISITKISINRPKP